MDQIRTTGPGQGGVHSHIGVEPSKGQGTSGKFDTGGEGAVDSAKQRAGEMADQAREQASGVANQAREQASDAADQARERVEDVRGRAEEMAGQARERASRFLDEAENSQPVQMAKENALPALGIAFAAGFLLAGSSDTSGRLGRAKQQIRGAVMGGISAALAQELRGMLGMQGGQGGGGLLDSLLGSQGGGQGGRQGSPSPQGGGSQF